jgi:hypothetical protein
MHEIFVVTHFETLNKDLCKNMYRENKLRGWQAFAMNVCLKSEVEQARRYQCWIIPTHETWQLECIFKRDKESVICVFSFHTSLCLTTIFVLQTLCKAELQ